MMPETATAGIARSVSSVTTGSDGAVVVSLLDQVAIDGLSFSELVGLLAFTPGVNLYADELTDDGLVVTGLQFALLAARAEDRRARGALAARVLERPQAPEHDYAALVARTVARVFGVTA
ncbi:hypothetical protein [Streptomyces sp. NPDC048445]|uniref:hypothetical protein n=1 Tax=Streptomyces sp. NPDC048445 TaxID=3365553 RepID=UPI003710B91A